MLYTIRTIIVLTHTFSAIGHTLWPQNIFCPHSTDCNAVDSLKSLEECEFFLKREKTGQQERAEMTEQTEDQ